MTGVIPAIFMDSPVGGPVWRSFPPDGQGSFGRPAPLPPGAKRPGPRPRAAWPPSTWTSPPGEGWRSPARSQPPAAMPSFRAPGLRPRTPSCRPWAAQGLDPAPDTGRGSRPAALGGRGWKASRPSCRGSPSSPSRWSPHGDRPRSGPSSSGAGERRGRAPGEVDPGEGVGDRVHGCLPGARFSTREQGHRGPGRGRTSRSQGDSTLILRGRRRPPRCLPWSGDARFHS